MVQGALVGSDTARFGAAERLAIAATVCAGRSRSGWSARCTKTICRAALEPAVLARYLVAVMRGMAVEAASGASATELNEIVDVALTAWPASKRRRRRVGESR